MLHQIANGKSQLKVKEQLLENVSRDIKRKDARRSEIEKAMQDTEEDIEKLTVPLDGKSDKVREAYLEMRANMQARNAESERQRTQLVTWLRDTLQPKMATATAMLASKERGV